MLTDSFLDRRGTSAPSGYLCDSLVDVCVPLAGRRIVDLRSGNAQVYSTNELMIEFELCIKLMFKPLRHHIARVSSASNSDALRVWNSVLGVLEDLLKEETAKAAPPSSPGDGNLVTDGLLKTMNELANEHLQNAILLLVDEGLLTGSEDALPGDFNVITWESIGRMGFCKNFVEDWKKAASAKN